MCCRAPGNECVVVGGTYICNCAEDGWQPTVEGGGCEGGEKPALIEQTAWDVVYNFKACLVSYS